MAQGKKVGGGASRGGSSGGNRGNGRGRKVASKSGARLSSTLRATPGLDPSLQEDVDKFMDGRGKIMLGEEQKGSDSESEEEIDVVGLGSDPDDSDDDSDDEDAGARKGVLSDDDDQDKINEDDNGWWGKKKGDYYDADDAEGSDDERAEEKEARKLQQKRSEGLRAEDFGDDHLTSSDEDEDEEEEKEERSLGHVMTAAKHPNTSTSSKKSKTDKKTDSKSKKAKKVKGDTSEGRLLEQLDEELLALDGNGMVRVARDLAALTDKDKKKLLQQHAPELASLMSDFKSYVKVLQEQLLPARRAAWAQVWKHNGGKDSSASKSSASKPSSSQQLGRDYLDTKIDVVSRYCTAVSFYLVLRSEGVDVTRHPVIHALASFRALLDKLKPLDAKVKKQIQHLVRLSRASTRASTRILHHATEEEEEEESGEDDGSERDEDEVEGEEEDEDVNKDDYEDSGEDEDEGEEEWESESEEEEEADADMFFPQLKTKGNQPHNRASISQQPGRKEVPGRSGGQEAGPEAWAERRRRRPSPGIPRQERTEFVEQEEDEDDEEEQDHEQHQHREQEDRLGRKRSAVGSRSSGFVDAGDLGDGLDGKDDDAAALRVMKKRSLNDYVTARDQARKSARAAKDTGEKDVPLRDRHAMILQVENRKRKERHLLEASYEAEQHARDSEGMEGGQEEGGQELPPEHPYYAQIKAQQQKTKADKAGKGGGVWAHAAAGYAPIKTVEEGEKRGAGYQITKNRGLVPHRNKDKKNPRVKHRIKYEKALTKERTSLYGKQKRTDNSTAYGGETTGIKTSIARSRRLDSKDH